MCLMCEWYFDSCYEQECYDAAVDPKERYITNSKISPRKIFLHKGITGPCRHMLEEHHADCAVVKRHPSKYGMVHDTCTCDELD